eukprot:3076370-Amphidinium_carterae.1
MGQNCFFFGGRAGVNWSEQVFDCFLTASKVVWGGWGGQGGFANHNPGCFLLTLCCRHQRLSNESLPFLSRYEPKSANIVPHVAP